MMFLTNCEGWPGLEAAREALESSRPALDVVESGIRPVEAEPSVDSVGRGGSPNLLGEVACDAAIMDGETLRAGSVGYLKDYLHAISVARQVMERLPHVMLVGDGAHRFADEIGAERAEMLTPDARRRYEGWMEKHAPADVRGAVSRAALTGYAWESAKEFGSGGTVVFLVRDANGRIAAGASTSGWPMGYPGRLGDTPVVGAGLYADSGCGACACTHTGEMALRAGTPRSVVLYMKAGASVEEACQKAVRDLGALRGGQQGALVIHAIDRDGNACVVTNRDMGEKSSYYRWSEEMLQPEHRQARVVT